VQTVVSDRRMAIGKVAHTLLLLSVTVAGKCTLASAVCSTSITVNALNALTRTLTVRQIL